MSNSYLSASDFFKTVRPDERVYFLVRHGERDHIRRDDPNHGAFVGLTARGREQAYLLGCTIRKEMGLANGGVGCGDLTFFSSPVGRCVETAKNIALGIFGSNAGKGGAGETTVTPLQPLAEFFVEHYDAYMETHATGFYQGICRWLDGTAKDLHYVDPAYYPLASRSEEMLKLMFTHGTGRLNIFCTHDAWIVPCLTHFCGLKFSPQLWMNFLTGMAVVTEDKPADGMPGGCSPAIKRIVPVTGIDNGNLIF